MVYKIGWFSSGEVKSREGRRAARELLGTVMEAKNDLDIEISFVFSNIEPDERSYGDGDEFFKLVGSYNLPLVTLSSQEFDSETRERGKKESMVGGKVDYANPSRTLRRWRDSYDKACLFPGYLGDYEKPDLCVLAGDMTIWGPVRCKYFDAINLHPALPNGPKGAWQNVIWEMIENGEQEHGVMMHLVTPELDRGPPVTFCRFPIRGAGYDSLWNDLDADTRSLEKIKEECFETHPLFKKMREDGVKREYPLVVETIRQFADGDIKIRDKKPYSASGLLEHGCDLTEQIDSEMGVACE